MYSENGCLLCREAEGTLRLLLGDTVFDDQFRVVKMTFDQSQQQAFLDCTGSAVIPKFFLGDFQSGAPLADSFEAMMKLVAAGQIYEIVGLPKASFPAQETADALVLGAGPAGLEAFSLLCERGYNPLLITETIGGKLTAALTLTQQNESSGMAWLRKRVDHLPGWFDKLRPGLDVQAIELAGASKILRAAGRTYTTNGPLVIAVGATVQHFELQAELDFLDQGLTYAADWTTFSNGRVTIYAPRGGAQTAALAARQMSARNNDVTVLLSDEMPHDVQRQLENTFAVKVLKGRVVETLSSGHPPRITAVRTREHTVPTDLLIWNHPFRSRGKRLFKAAFGTEWLSVNDNGEVLDETGHAVSGVYGVGDALETSAHTLDFALEAVRRLERAIPEQSP